MELASEPFSYISIESFSHMFRNTSACLKNIYTDICFLEFEKFTQIVCYVFVFYLIFKRMETAHQCTKASNTFNASPAVMYILA